MLFPHFHVTMLDYMLFVLQDRSVTTKSKEASNGGDSGEEILSLENKEHSNIPQTQRQFEKVSTPTGIEVTEPTLAKGNAAIAMKAVFVEPNSSETSILPPGAVANNISDNRSAPIAAQSSPPPLDSTDVDPHSAEQVKPHMHMYYAYTYINYGYK